jgi:hypothetical protein
MSLVKTSDVREWWAPILALVMIVALSTISFVLLHRTYPPIGTTPAAAEPGLAEASTEHAVAQQAPGGPASPSGDADGPAAGPTSGPEQVTVQSEHVGVQSKQVTIESDQVSVKSLRALETIDPRELLRRAAVPTDTMLQ